jgi:hypothetical protein
MDSSQLTRYKKDRYTANGLNGVQPRPIYPLDEEKRIGYKNGSKIVTYNKRTVLPGCTGPTCNEDLISQPQGTVVFDTMTTVLQTSNFIQYVVVDSNGNIFWVESIGTGPVTGYKIRKRDSTNIITDVYTFTLDGTSPEASQIILDNNNNLYFFDKNVTFGFCLTKITPSGTISQFINSGIPLGPVDGLTMNKENGDIYFVLPTECAIYKTNISGTTPIRIAGSGTVGYLDSLNPLNANFNEPFGITFDKQNNYLYIAELINNDIRKMDLNTGFISTYSSTAGSAPAPGGGTGPSQGNTVNVDHTLSQFFTPQDIEIDSSGNLYICDKNNNQIKKIDSSGFVTLFAGSGSYGITNGPPLTSATFSLPVSTFIRSPTEMYIADSTNFAIRKITGSYQ